MQLTNYIAAFALAFAVGSQATHTLGSSCSGSDINTNGCSKDQCTVIRCSTSGNGHHYWEFKESCIGRRCENGACDSNFPDGSCKA